ncbi:4660_t:CDS:2 [Ambispora leptoticha]|uniref:4660_t:CDS:1 n=1 Tax=Ambispora leptoticha TaxID=144679 RepID=A0A9N9CDQ4_9GLOM|nr:4660_t:CDS:2 [Ambispora leptoticha]
MHLSEYEIRRLENIASNQKMLIDLGLDKPPPVVFAVSSTVNNKSQKRKPSAVTAQPRCVVRKTAANERLGLRRSQRISSMSNPKFLRELKDEEDYFDDDESTYKRKIDPKDRNPQIFGHIPGIEVGTTWEMRIHCSQDGVHAPTVAGISGNQQEGAYSIALSGGYEDDVDWGEGFTYTGSGGRDLKGTRSNPKNLRTAKQSKDQTLEGKNLALKVSCDTGRPVRVIRGYKLNSPYAPVSGYRYDGLYRVDKCWQDRGLSGFQVIKFAFVRLPGQPPIEARINYDIEERDPVPDDDEMEESDNKD